MWGRTVVGSNVAVVEFATYKQICADANNVAAVKRRTKTRYKREWGGAVVRYSRYKTVLRRTQNKVEKYCSVHKSGMDKRNVRASQPVWLASTTCTLVCSPPPLYKTLSSRTQVDSHLMHRRTVRQRDTDSKGGAGRTTVHTAAPQLPCRCLYVVWRTRANK